MFKKLKENKEDILLDEKLDEQEILFLFPFFINNLEKKIVDNFKPFKLHLDIFKQINEINNTSYRRKIYFENFNNEYYEVIDDIFNEFFKVQKTIKLMDDVNFYSLTNSYVHDKNIIEKKTNQFILCLSITGSELQNNIYNLFKYITSLLNEIYIDCHEFIQTKFKKNINKNLIIDEDINNYKKISNLDRFFYLFEGFENSLRRRVKNYKQVVIQNSFFVSLSEKERSLLNYNSFLSNQLRRYDIFLFQKYINEVFKFISIYESNEKEKNKRSFISFNINDLFSYFFNLSKLSIFS